MNTTADTSQLNAAFDVDPEVVRASLREFIVELKEAEQQRDLARAEAAELTKQLTDCEEQRDRANNRLTALNKSLGQLEEGKRGSDGRLASAQTALMLQEETIRRCEREKKALGEKVKYSSSVYQTKIGQCYVGDIHLLFHNIRQQHRCNQN